MAPVSDVINNGMSLSRQTDRNPGDGNNKGLNRPAETIICLGLTAAMNSSELEVFDPWWGESKIEDFRSVLFNTSSCSTLVLISPAKRQDKPSPFICMIKL